MSLDTTYRPKDFDDVLGQEASVKILRRFVNSGKGRHQSYLFCGPYGSGKTTMGRILARALLCETPTAAGDPCNACETCRSILELGSAINFTEVDAATNSGKSEIQRITEEIQYDTFSGRRRIYLFDEAHQLSPSALDAMLKPLEENFPGSTEKKLVCIFCTTEPEKMRPTIFSRCAPAFVIQPVAPALLAKRLALICDKEGITYDPAMLQSLAEMTECHIRDALKAIEGISMLGGISKENVISYMHLDLNGTYLEILEALGTDLGKAMELAKQVLLKSSPATCYEKMADLALLAYQSTLGGITLPTYLDADRLRALGQKHGAGLIGMATRMSARPARPTQSMLLCDLGVMHHGGGAVGAASVVVVSQAAPAPSPAPVAPTGPVPAVVASPTIAAPAAIPSHSAPISGRVQKAPTSGEPGVKLGAKNDGSDPRSVGTRSSEMSLDEFGLLLGNILKEEIGGAFGGSERLSDMGSR